jgi:hypothetical protein
MGRRPPKNAKALHVGDFLRTGAQPVFPIVDNLSSISWAGTMLGNDSFGDCVGVLLANGVRLFSRYLGSTQLNATLAEVVAIYKTQNPGFDQNSQTHGPDSPDDGGMDIQTVLEYWIKNGITIGGVKVKAYGFAKLDVTNLPQLRAACSVFGGLMLGVNVASAQQTQFPSQPWDYVKGSPIEGGHAILGGGHQDKTKDEIRFVCWAAEDTLTDAFIQKQLEEAWVVITEFHLNSKEFIAAMDMPAFAAAYTTITGQPFPVAVTPAPVPTPVPTPTPTPTPAPVPTPVPAVGYTLTYDQTKLTVTAGNGRITFTPKTSS